MWSANNNHGSLVVINTVGCGCGICRRLEELFMLFALKTKKKNKMELVMVIICEILRWFVLNKTQIHWSWFTIIFNLILWCTAHNNRGTASDCVSMHIVTASLTTTSVIQKMQHSHQEMMNATFIYADTAVANEEEDVWISMFEYAGDYSEWGCV